MSKWFWRKTGTFRDIALGIHIGGAIRHGAAISDRVYDTATRRAVPPMHRD
ncbi:hypothetical protein ACFV9W_31640 [Streptomyces sp. NPDC059897]|uniref:hypothetical protein n=1 Tax=Streptomyces sp. NPDC059897 TaxID=3346994 RepID=UPI0036483506